MGFKSLFASQLGWLSSVWFLSLIPFIVGTIGGFWIYQGASAVALQSLGNDFQQLTLEITDAIEGQGHRYEGILTSLSIVGKYLDLGNHALREGNYLRSIEQQAGCPEGCTFGFVTLDARVQGSHRAAMAHALETRAPFAVSDPPLHTPEPAIPQHARLTMYTPLPNSGLVLRADLSEGAVPMAYMAMDASALTDHRFATRQAEIAWELYDRDPVGIDESPLIHSAVQTLAIADHAPLFSSSRPFRFGGKVWTLRFHSLPEFEAGLDVEKPQRLLRNMILLGIFLSIITWLELSTRRRATCIANRQTSELRKLGRAVDQSPVSTVIANARGDIEYVSGGYHQISGYGAEELIGKPLTALQFEFTTDAQREQLWANISAGKVWKGTLHSRRKNGTLYWESQTISALNDAQGKPTHLMVTKENVTERKKTEERLRKSEAFSLAIMESIGDAIVVLDRSGVVIQFNRAWRRFTDESGPCPHAAAVHTGVDANFLALCDDSSYFTSAADANAVREGIKAVLAGRLPSFQYDYACQTKTDLRWFSLVAMPMDAVRAGAVISNSDITERKVVEVDSLTYQYQLEKMVGNSTVQLGTLADQLMKTETRERSSLAEDLHDDLGQSLTVLKFKLQSLKFPAQFEGREHILHQLGEIESVVDRSSQSVRSISSHLSPPVLQHDGLHAALQWLAEDMQDTYGLVVHIEWEVAVSMDESLGGTIYRTVRELLINVWKHADTDSAEVSVHMDAYSGMIVVSVVDAGRGFDVREIQIPSTKLSYGLYSVHERMNLIGATLKIDSTPGVGTSVLLMIPARALRHKLKVKDSDSTFVSG